MSDAAAVKGLCKTYAASTTKLLYAFSALSDQSSKADGAASVSAAIESNARTDAIEQIVAALAAGVEKVLRATDVSLRSQVLRDLRARFKPNEKPATAEQATQASVPREKLAAPERSPPRPTKENKQAFPIEPEGAAAAAAAVAVAGAPVGSALPPISSAGAPTADDAAQPPVAGAGAKFAMYERMRLWEARKAARLEVERTKKKEQTEAEMAPPEKRRSSLKYAHVSSALRVEREGEEERKLAAAEERVREAAQAREEAERRSAAATQETARVAERMRASEEARLQAEEALHAARVQIEQERREAERLRAQNEKGEEAREMLEALDGRVLESWPIVPGRKVLRVHESDDFDGRVSAEFRVKDVEGGERGVSLMMGRSVVTRQPEIQCVLFDDAVFSDLDAARWWAANRYRLEKRALRGKPAPRRA